MFTIAEVATIVTVTEEGAINLRFLKSIILIIAIVFSAQQSGFAQDVQNTVFKVKYLSAESVYLDGGRLEGLMVGDQLLIMRNGTSVATIEIVYLADHSSSCKVIKKKKPIKAKDRVKILKMVKRPDQNEKSELANKERTFRKRQVGSKKTDRWAKVSGRLSMQWYGWFDNNISGLDFTQPSARLSLRLRNLWGSNYNFNIKMRSKYNKRSRSFSKFAPESEWIHRVYSASISYRNEEAPTSFSVGRIITNKISGVGYIDGAQVEQKIYKGFSVGVFGGTQPEWRRSSFQTDVKKYGGYLNYQHGDFRGTRFESTLAGAGEYGAKDVSREFFYLRNSLYIGGKWSVYHSMQVDLNRGWRKEATGKSFQISNLYVSANYQAWDWMSVGLGYDNRQNYRTAQTRSIPDSLFDDALRQGVRASINFKLPARFRLNTNFTMRMRENDVSNTYSGGMNLTNNNLFNQRLFFSLRFIGYNNHFSTGFNPSVTLGKAIWGGHRVNVSYGNYTYIFANNNRTTSNQWARIDADVTIISHLYTSIQYEYNWGGDLVGHRTFLELGYRL